MPPAYPIIQQSTDHDGTDYDYTPLNVGLLQPNEPSIDIEQGATAGLPSRTLLLPRIFRRKHALLFILLQFVLICYFLFILLFSNSRNFETIQFLSPQLTNL